MITEIKILLALVRFS